MNAIMAEPSRLTVRWCDVLSDLDLEKLTLVPIEGAVTIWKNRRAVCIELFNQTKINLRYRTLLCWGDKRIVW